LFPLFATGGIFTVGVVDTSGNNISGTRGKFAAGVVDTSGKFAAGVVDTSGAPRLANISAYFRKNSRAWGKMIHEKT
jgi:hypothetical protein